MSDRLIFQLGTNNWQRSGEFAPGPGILHEAHHHAYNALPGVRAYSMGHWSSLAKLINVPKHAAAT